MAHASRRSRAALATARARGDEALAARIRFAEVPAWRALLLVDLARIKAAASG